ncbi:hypothetical protein WJX74_006766 [Apatococcus lobatus]|uniref:Cytochrome P450 n=1 Tax=Apatococcus lobatus TaxID=904363 RepID=A0AAW1QAI3_9CHLO
MSPVGLQHTLSASPAAPVARRAPLSHAQLAPRQHRNPCHCRSRSGSVDQLSLPGDKAPPGPADFVLPTHLERLRKYGPVYKLGSSDSKTVVVADPSEVQALLSADFHHVANDWGKGVLDLLGPYALVNQQGEMHKAARRVLTKGFSKEATLAYVPDVVRLASEFLSRWSQAENIPLLGELKCFNFDISCSLIMGFDVEEQERRQQRKHFTALTAGFFAAPFEQSNPLAAAALTARTKLREGIHPRVTSAPDQAASDGDTQKAKQLTPLQRLNAIAEAEDEALSLEELLDQSLMLLNASTETTAFTMCNMIMELESNPSIAQKLADEQKALAEEHGQDLSGVLLDHMVYGEAVIREALRIHSPVPFVFRKALTDLTVGSYTIPEGWTLQLALRQMDLEPHMVPEQPGFHPERWLDDSGNLIEQPRSFMPFGGGAHLCLGWMLAKLEMKVLIALLVRGFTCQQARPSQPLAATVSDKDDIILMSFRAKY